MTKEEILAMEAGRGLDAQVSENVMGIKCGATLADGRLEPITMSWEDVPLYSTDISVAWQVLDKVTEEKHCHCEMKVYSDGLASIKFTKATGPFTPDKILGCAGADDDMPTPEAICKAALLAKLEAGST